MGAVKQVLRFVPSKEEEPKIVFEATNWSGGFVFIQMTKSIRIPDSRSTLLAKRSKRLMKGREREKRIGEYNTWLGFMWLGLGLCDVRVTVLFRLGGRCRPPRTRVLVWVSFSIFVP